MDFKDIKVGDSVFIEKSSYSEEPSRIEVVEKVGKKYFYTGGWDSEKFSIETGHSQNQIGGKRQAWHTEDECNEYSIYSDRRKEAQEKIKKNDLGITSK